MIEEEAFVADVSGNQVWIEKKPKSACSSCSESCTSAVAGKFYADKTLRFPVISLLSVQPGDRVIVGLPEQALLQGAFRMYLFPLLGLLGGALLGKWLASAAGLPISDGLGAFSGFLGFLTCLGILKHSRFFDRSNLRPVILRKIN